MDAIRKAYDTHVEKGGDKLEYSMRFANFMQSLVSDKVVPEDCLLVKVLKCITNGMSWVLLRACECRVRVSAACV